MILISNSDIYVTFLCNKVKSLVVVLGVGFLLFCFSQLDCILTSVQILGSNTWSPYTMFWNSFNALGV